MLRGQLDADAAGGSTGIHIVKENTRTPRKIPDMEDEKEDQMRTKHRCMIKRIIVDDIVIIVDDNGIHSHHLGRLHRLRQMREGLHTRTSEGTR